MTDFVSDLKRVDERPGTTDHPTEAERGNTLLEALDQAEWSLIEPHLERVSLTRGQVLEERSRPAAFLYFPINGAVSVEAGSGKEHLQLALVGREGLIGVHLLVGGTAVSRASVQFAGAAWRISAQALQACLNKSPRLHRELLLGVGTFVVRLSLMSWGAWPRHDRAAVGRLAADGG